MILINVMLGLIGFFGWLWVWVRSRYNTHETKRVQIGVGLFGFMWLLLIMADLVQGLQPTVGTILARLVIIVALFCLKSKLLEHKDDE